MFLFAGINSLTRKIGFCFWQFVYDKDTFSFDDKMGDAEFEIDGLFKASKTELKNIPDGTIISKALPTRQNCLAEESKIMLSNNRLVQDMVVRLRNVECGEVELQLQWVDLVPSQERSNA